MIANREEGCLTYLWLSGRLLCLQLSARLPYLELSGKVSAAVRKTTGSTDITKIVLQYVELSVRLLYTIIRQFIWNCLLHVPCLPSAAAVQPASSWVENKISDVRYCRPSKAVRQTTSSYLVDHQRPSGRYYQQLFGGLSASAKQTISHWRADRPCCQEKKKPLVIYLISCSCQTTTVTSLQE